MADAYSENLPCKNPNCHSNGKPHPNCHCYPNLMAEGGEVGHFCTSNRPHASDCEYYAEGGPVVVPTEPLDPIMAMATGAYNIFKGVPNYERSVNRGRLDLKRSVDALLEGSSAKTESDDAKRTRLKVYMDKGGINQEISRITAGETPVSDLPPDANALVNMAKTRISNYLTNHKPVASALQPHLPFDRVKVNKDQERIYNQVLDIADNPLRVVDEAAAGTLTKQQLQHFVAMYPELNDKLQEELTARVVKAQIDNQIPPVKARKALSTLLGVPLDSSLTPNTTMAVQALYAHQAAMSAPVGSTTKGKTKSSKAIEASEQDELTSTQAAAKRAQNPE